MDGDKVAYRLRDNEIAAEQFEDDFVVLDLEGGKYYALDGASALVWQAIVGGATLEAILGAADASRHLDIRAFVDKLLQHELIAKLDEAPSGVALPEGLSALDGAIKLEVFDDLSELLVADPIHDVDEEAGWPHRKD